MRLRTIYAREATIDLCTHEYPESQKVNNPMTGELVLMFEWHRLSGAARVSRGHGSGLSVLPVPVFDTLEDALSFIFDNAEGVMVLGHDRYQVESKTIH